MKIVQSSAPPRHLPAGLFIFSLPVHHNTKHNLDSTTFSLTTLYTEPLFQNLYSRQAAQTNRSPTRQFREWQKPAQHRSHKLWAQRACDNFWKFSGRHLPIIRCTERIWKAKSTSSNYWLSEGMWTQSLLDHTMAETSSVEKMSYLQSQTHFDESTESIADSDLEDGEIQKCSLQHWMPKGLLGNQMQWSFGRERSKCTNVSFIRRPSSFRETGCIVFTKT